MKMMIAINLSNLFKGESSGRPGLVKRKVKVTRGGKVFEQYRWVRPGDDAPAEKKGTKEEPTKELAIVGLNKPKEETEAKGWEHLHGNFAQKLKTNDWVNIRGRMVQVQSIDKKSGTVTVGSKGSFIPDETYSLDRLNEIGKPESPSGKFKEEKPKPALHPRPTQRKKPKVTPKEKPKVVPKTEEKPKEKPKEKPEKKPAGWLKPEYKVVSGKKPEKFAHTLKAGDWVNFAGRMMKVAGVKPEIRKILLGSKLYDFDEVDEKGKSESPKGKFKKIEINLQDVEYQR